MIPEIYSIPWLEITEFLEEHEWLHKWYSRAGGWAFLTNRYGTRTKVDHNWTLDEVKTLVYNIKQTYEN